MNILPNFMIWFADSFVLFSPKDLSQFALSSAVIWYKHFLVRQGSHSLGKGVSSSSSLSSKLFWRMWRLTCHKIEMRIWETGGKTERKRERRKLKNLIGKMFACKHSDSLENCTPKSLFFRSPKGELTFLGLKAFLYTRACRKANTRNLQYYLIFFLGVFCPFSYEVLLRTGIPGTVFGIFSIVFENAFTSPMSVNLSHCLSSSITFPSGKGALVPPERDLKRVYRRIPFCLLRTLYCKCT